VSRVDHTHAAKEHTRPKIVAAVRLDLRSVLDAPSQGLPFGTHGTETRREPVLWEWNQALARVDRPLAHVDAGGVPHPHDLDRGRRETQEPAKSGDQIRSDRRRQDNSESVGRKTGKRRASTGATRHEGADPNATEGDDANERRRAIDIDDTYLRVVHRREAHESGDGDSKSLRADLHGRVGRSFQLLLLYNAQLKGKGSRQTRSLRI
jgi:hypothetical protein